MFYQHIICYVIPVLSNKAMWEIPKKYKYIYDGVTATLHDLTLMLRGLICFKKMLGVLSHNVTILCSMTLNDLL